MNERVLGYDARECWLPGPEIWPERRRGKYLLRADVVRPLSTDVMVWSSVFTEADEVSAGAPRWLGPIGGLWDELARLRGQLDRAWGERWRPCRVVAVTVVDGLCSDEERARWDARIVGIVPAGLAAGWELLGYDVSDEYLLSGLSNCGYEAGEVDALRRRWGPHLNMHHLFDDVEKAGEFMVETDQRVEEHAPFYVYGIYSIERIDEPADD